METKSMKEHEMQLKNSIATNNNARFALTTFDNPFDPFTQFSDWLMFDNLQGYGTCSYLARVCFLADSLTANESNEEVERAIDEIIANDFLGIYKKVENKNYKNINI